MSTLQTVRAVCPHDCPDACAMLVTLDGERAIAVRGDREHPFTRGFLCHKVSRYPERVYHRDRLMFPMRRIGPKGSGQFERISWDAALDEIAARLKGIANGPHGPQAILPYSYCGTMGKIQSEGLDRRFFHRLGASLLDRTICATAGVAGYTATIGSRQGTDPEAFSQSSYIINWGSNTAVTNMHLWVRMVEARKRLGAKIVTIDPYRSQTAVRSDWHLAPRPGTDAALALGLMHVLFRDGLADEDYLEKYCLGMEQLRERVLNDYNPQRVAGITGLDEADIERLAHEYATASSLTLRSSEHIEPHPSGSGPEFLPVTLPDGRGSNDGPASVIRINYGLQRHAGGGMAVRTIACLPAIIGAWRNPAGGILLSTSSSFPFNLTAVQRPDLIPPGTRTVNMVQLAEALHGELPGPPVQALFVYNSNPAAIAPDQQRVLAGLRREDLFTVVHEQFPTDTADFADILLPATTQLEHFDLHGSYGHQYVQVNVPAIAPLGESRCNTDVFRGLARRLGFESELIDASDEQLARDLLWETAAPDNVPFALRGITLERLRREGPIKVNAPIVAAPLREAGSASRSEAATFAPFANGGFATPSGKCEFLCERLAKLGHDPLPTYIPPAESPDSAPELAAKFPLQLLSPPSPHFLNSTFVEVDSLRRSAIEPQLEISHADAAARGIQQGELVTVFNDRGSFIARALVGDSVRPGVVVAPSIWWNKHSLGNRNCNSTTPTRLTDLGGGATFFDNLVQVERQE